MKLMFVNWFEFSIFNAELFKLQQLITIVYSTFYHTLGRLQSLITQFLTLRFALLNLI